MNKACKTFYPISLVLLLSGCASALDKRDPLEPFNRGVYKFNDTVDKAVLKPVAKGYQAVVPDPLQLMVRSFFSNLGDVVVVVNDLLQFKLLQATSDAGRVVVNSTVGMLGLADVASVVGMEKHSEDFGQTLGYWGLKSGPYLVLPLLGSSSFRDGIGTAVDGQFDPIWRTSKMAMRNKAIAAKTVSTRADLLGAEKVLNEAALDPYVFVRESYLQHRQSQVYDGNPPLEDFEEDQ